MKDPKKYLDYVDNPELATYEQIAEVNEKLDEVNEGLKPFKGVDLGKLENLKGEKGDKGDIGPKGEKGDMPIRGKDYFHELDVKTFLDKVTPVKGVHYNDGVDGKDGENGKDGKDGKDGKNGKSVESDKLVQMVLDFLNDPKNADKIKLPASFKGFGYLKDGRIDTRDERWHGSGTTTVLPTFVYNEVPSGHVDGINAIFTLENAPSPANSLQLFLNGQYMQLAGGDYTLSGITITFNIAPLSGGIILANYQY